MIIVLQLGMSKPDSMIVVHTRMSYFPSTNCDIRRSSLFSPHLPVAYGNPRVGEHFAEVFGGRLYRRNAVVEIEDLPVAGKLAPTASRTASSEYSRTTVSTGKRFLGGVSMRLIVRAPIIAK